MHRRNKFEDILSNLRLCGFRAVHYGAVFPLWQTGTKRYSCKKETVINMKDYSAADLISAALSITKINSIWKSKTSYWERPEKLPRDLDGLLYFVSGSIRYYFGDTEFEVHPGQVLRLPRGVPYNGIRLSDETLEFYVIDFISDDENSFSAYPLPYSFTPSDSDTVKDMFASLERKWSTPSPCYLLDCLKDTLDLISYLTKDHMAGDTQSRAIRISEYIAQNSHNAGFKLSDARVRFHLSETHLRRIFAHEFGRSPMAYLSDVRIEKAKRMLISEKDMSIEQISEKCGYASLYYFSGTFKKKVGVSPSEYRSAQKNLV